MELFLVLVCVAVVVVILWKYSKKCDLPIEEMSTTKVEPVAPTKPSFQATEVKRETSYVDPAKVEVKEVTFLHTISEPKVEATSKKPNVKKPQKPRANKTIKIEKAQQQVQQAKKAKVKNVKPPVDLPPASTPEVKKSKRGPKKQKAV